MSKTTTGTRNKLYTRRKKMELNIQYIFFLIVFALVVLAAFYLTYKYG